MVRYENGAFIRSKKFELLRPITLSIAMHKISFVVRYIHTQIQKHKVFDLYAGSKYYQLEGTSYE